jgi:hypothetical protein
MVNVLEQLHLATRTIERALRGHQWARYSAANP